MTLVLDAGAFVAVERGDREIIALLKSERLQGRSAVTHGGVVAQVWRGGDDRQAHLARLLRAVEVVPLDDALGRAAGILLGVAGTSDAIDAAVVLLSRDRDEVLTSNLTTSRSWPKPPASRSTWSRSDS